MTEDSYAALLDELLDLYPQLDDLTLDPLHRPATYLVHGWYMRVHRNVGALLLLSRNGYEAEAGPIRRSIIEHTVALKWLAQDDGVAATVVRRGHAFDAGKRKEAIEAAGWGAPSAIFDEVIGDLAATEGSKQHDHLLLFKRRCEAYGNPHDWSVYLIETSQSHPGWETAVAYLSEEQPPRALSEPRSQGRDDVGFSALHLLESLAAVSDMMASSPWVDRLTAMAERVRALDNAVRRERGMPEW